MSSLNEQRARWGMWLQARLANPARWLSHVRRQRVQWDTITAIATLVLFFLHSAAGGLAPVSGGPPPVHHRRHYRSDGELPRLWMHSKLTVFAAQKPTFSPWSEVDTKQDAASSALAKLDTVNTDGKPVKPSVLALLFNVTDREAAAAAAATAAAAAEASKVRTRRTAPSQTAASASGSDDRTENGQHGGDAGRHAFKLSVCDSVSDWVQMTEAENMWGVRVNLSQSIHVGGQVLNQYFYETFCRYDDERPCRGIDTLFYTSTCENRYIWAYARVETNNLAEEWTLIKVRGSCSCALYRRQHQQQTLSVWDDLRR